MPPYDSIKEPLSVDCMLHLCRIWLFGFHFPSFIECTFQGLLVFCINGRLCEVLGLVVFVKFVALLSITAPHWCNELPDATQLALSAGCVCAVCRLIWGFGVWLLLFYSSMVSFVKFFVCSTLCFVSLYRNQMLQDLGSYRLTFKKLLKTPRQFSFVKKEKRNLLCPCALCCPPNSRPILYAAYYLCLCCLCCLCLCFGQASAECNVMYCNVI